MSRFVLCLSFLSMAAFALSLVGCGGSSDSSPAPSEPASPAPEAAAPAEGAHAAHAPTEQGPYAAALAELSEADRALVEKQKVCPVSGEPLGSMGKPYKVTVKGREVFLCCPGCEADIKSDPDKYLAKLSD